MNNIKETKSSNSRKMFLDIFFSQFLRAKLETQLVCV